MHGWQRLWVVLSTVWLTVIVVLMLLVGFPRTFTPPRVSSWTLTCDVEAVAQRLMAQGEQEQDIAPILQGAQDHQIAITFWIPEHADGKSANVHCADAHLVYDKSTGHRQLAVFGTLFDFSAYATFHDGADLPGFFGPIVTGEWRQLRGPGFSDQS